MPFRVRIPDSVGKLIRDIRPKVDVEVLAQLAVLAERPRIGTPAPGAREFEGLLAYRFRVDRLPLSREFAVLYTFDPKEEDIFVVDFVGVLDGASMTFGTAEFQKRR